MKVVFEGDLHYKIIADFEGDNEFLKTGEQMAQSIREMICDEASYIGVAEVDVTNISRVITNE